MKLNKVWASALALLALTACNKDMEPSSENISAPEAKTKVVRIDLSASQSSEDLRVLFGVKPGESGALSGLEMSEKDVWLRVAIRQGNGKPEVKDLRFTKTKGRNHAVCSDEITIPVGGTGNYQIAALLVREEGGEKFLVEETSSNAPGRFISNRLARVATDNLVTHSGNTVSVNIPYYSEWQDISVTESGVVEPVSLKMKPFGTVLRMRIKNESATEKTFYWLNFQSNAFVASGSFSFEEEELGRPRFFQGNAEYVKFKINGTNGITVPGKVGEEAQYSPWIYAWFSPRLNPQFIDFHTSAYLLTTKDFSDVAGTPYKVFSTKLPLRQGSVPLTLVYNGTHQAGFDDVWNDPEEFGANATFTSPLEYISEFPVNATGDGFISDYSPFAEVKRCSYDEAVAEFGTPRPIGGANYSLPTREELHSIFPSRTSSSGYAMSELPANKPIYDVVEENIKLGKSYQATSFKADYIRRGGNVSTLFGIRFKGGDNKYRTAFRYKKHVERVDDVDHVSMIVESTLIGNESVNLSDIQQESFWTSRPTAPSDPKRVFSRRFPTYGATYLGSNAGVSAQNVTLSFWSSTRQENDAAYQVWLIPQYGVVALSLSSTSWQFPVYLWKRD